MRVCAPPPSIEQMLAANPGKTPISLLQEYGTRIGKTPVYDLLKAEGQAHQPNFTFRVTVGDTSCTGEEGLGQPCWGVHSQGPNGFISWSLFTVLFSKSREGGRGFRGKSHWLDWENRSVRRWVVLGSVRGASKIATVIWQIVSILEEKRKGDKPKSQRSVWGVSVSCAGLCSRCLI